MGAYNINFILFSLQPWVGMSLLGPDAIPNLDFMQQEGWDRTETWLLCPGENSVCSWLTARTTNLGLSCPLLGSAPWEKGWLCDSLSARDDRPVCYPLTPYQWGLPPLPYSSHCPQEVSPYHFVSVPDFLSMSLFVCSEEFSVISNPWWWPRAGPMLFVICWTRVFCSPSDRQKIPIFSLTNWQYVPGLGVGNSHCFLSYQIMCWTPHPKSTRLWCG